MSEIENPHAQHCCNLHGCRFNNIKCSVVLGIISQINKCGESSICSEYRHFYITEHDVSSMKSQHVC